MKIQSRWAKATLGGAVVGTMLLPIGALGSRFGIWPFTVGFLMLAAGVLLAVLALVVGIVGLVVTARAAASATEGQRSEYPALALGIALSVLILGGIGTLLGSARSVPAIHNISTDLADPPSFQTIAGLREGANPHRYDAGQQIGDQGTLGQIQRSAYPDVGTLQTTVGVAAGVDRAVSVLEGMGLEIVAVDAANGTVEATATTFWFGFKDDVVVRLRPGDEGTVVDVHSVSRVGTERPGGERRSHHDVSRAIYGRLIRR